MGSPSCPLAKARVDKDKGLGTSRLCSFMAVAAYTMRSAGLKTLLSGQGQGLLGFISLGWVTLGLPVMLNHTKEHRETDEMRGKRESDKEERLGSRRDTLRPEGSQWDSEHRQLIPTRPWARASMPLASYSLNIPQTGTETLRGHMSCEE